VIGIPSTPSYSDDGSQKTPVYTFADGTTHNGPTLTAITSTPGYMFYGVVGFKKIVTYSFNDGSSNSKSYSGLLSNTAFSTDYLTSTLTVTFEDGTSHQFERHADTYITYSADHKNQTVHFNYGDSFVKGITDSVTKTFEATSVSAPSWASDHVTRTTTYTYTYGNPVTVSEHVDPTDVAPSLTNAKYPSNWATGNTTNAVVAPQTSPFKSVYGDGATNLIYQDGSTSKPFSQSTLKAAAISDPNAVVKSTTETSYDLRWVKTGSEWTELCREYCEKQLLPILCNAISKNIRSYHPRLRLSIQLFSFE
jgi:hypothetical protein